MGIYNATSSELAIDACVRDAGYASVEDMLIRTNSDALTLTAREVVAFRRYVTAGLESKYCSLPSEIHAHCGGKVVAVYETDPDVEYISLLELANDHWIELWQLEACPSEMVQAALADDDWDSDDEPDTERSPLTHWTNLDLFWTGWLSGEAEGTEVRDHHRFLKLMKEFRDTGKLKNVTFAPGDPDAGPLDSSHVDWSGFPTSD